MATIHVKPGDAELLIHVKNQSSQEGLCLADLNAAVEKSLQKKPDMPEEANAARDGSGSASGSGAVVSVIGTIERSVEKEATSTIPPHGDSAAVPAIKVDLRLTCPPQQ